MFPNRGQAAGCGRKRKAPQRRELVPLFGRVAQDPFYRACVIIDADDKIFPARNDQRVIRAIVGKRRCYGTSRLAPGKRTGWDHLPRPSWLR